MIKPILAVVFLLAANPAWATAQLPEKIIIGGKEEALLSEPLAPLIRKDPNLSRQIMESGGGGMCTALWRGYRGIWEIDGDGLFLTGIEIDACSSSPHRIGLSGFFPGNPGKVKAEWFSGELIVPQGRMTKYVHMGYQSSYERYLVYKVEEGRITGQSEQVPASK